MIWSSDVNLEIFSMSYLWTPIHVKNPRNEDWEKVDEHFGKRLLSIWKRNHMSTGGHLTLRNSVLSSIPFVHDVFLCNSKRGIEEFYCFRSNVFWQSDDQMRKYCLAKWEILC